MQLLQCLRTHYLRSLHLYQALALTFLNLLIELCAYHFGVQVLLP